MGQFRSETTPVEKAGIEHEKEKRDERSIPEGGESESELSKGDDDCKHTSRANREKDEIGTQMHCESEEEADNDEDKNMTLNGCSAVGRYTNLKFHTISGCKENKKRLLMYRSLRLSKITVHVELSSVGLCCLPCVGVDEELTNTKIVQEFVFENEKNTMQIWIPKDCDTTQLIKNYGLSIGTNQMTEEMKLLFYRDDTVQSICHFVIKNSAEHETDDMFCIIINLPGENCKYSQDNSEVVKGGTGIYDMTRLKESDAEVEQNIKAALNLIEQYGSKGMYVLPGSC